MRNNNVIPAAAFALLCAASFLPGSAAADPMLLVRSEGRPISRLFVGDHLEVGLAGAAPSTSYGVSLRDDDGALIKTVSLTTDAAGSAGPVRFWSHSGVVGCDLSSDPYPAEYRFQSFAEAETALGGRTFTLEAIDSDAVQAAQLALPIVVAPREQAYFSDAAGCLRFYFKDSETVYLALRRPDRTVPTRRIFLTPPGSFEIGSPLADVRGFAGMQTWTLPATGDPAVVALWSAAATGIGSYSGILRWENTNTPMLLATDRYVWAGYLILEGIVISTDGCPTCDRP